MSEWLATSRLAMAVTAEKIREKREPIILERLNFMQYLRPIVRTLLSFWFF